jgi:putative ABC transport system permease protein
MRISIWFDQLLHDARYALRTLRRSSGVSAVVVLTLALGISLSTAAFSVFNAVVLRPVAYPHPERLLWLSTIQEEGETGIVLGPDFVDWRERATSIERMAAYGLWDATVTGAAGPVRARLAVVTEDFWDVTGARPAIGRLPTVGERDAVVLSHAVAQRWFAGDGGAIGRTVTLEGQVATIVGVMPDDFRFHLPAPPWPGFRPKSVDIYQPMFISPVREGMIGLFNVVGRLKPAVTVAQARGELQVIHSRIAEEHPNPFLFDGQRTLRVVPLQDQLVGGARIALLVMLGAVGCVLLIACANAANLLLARASTRHAEIAIRVSLGAGRLRVLQQSLVESLVLALLGSASGLLIAWLAVAIITRVGPESVPRLGEAAIDGSVVAVAIGLGALTALVFGSAPALALWRVNPTRALRTAANGASRHVTRMRARSVILGAQIALALVLLIGAGLLLKSAWRLTAHPPGFEPAQILTAKIDFTGPAYRDAPARKFAVVDALLDGLRTQPGVEAASISTHGMALTQRLVVEGAPEPSADELARLEPIVVNSTTASLRRVLGLRVTRGRWIADNERAVVLNERLARRDFPGQDPIGRRIRLDEGGPFLTIVGVAADVRYSRLDADPEPEIYVPYTQHTDMFGAVALVRTTSDPLALAPAIRQLMERIDQSVILDEVMTLQQRLAETIAPRRWNLLMLGTFAASALALALIGIYGLMTFSVAQRRQEIGVRRALGAQRLDVVRMVVRQGMSIAMAGIALGVVSSAALTRVMSSLLYEVAPSDPQTFVVVTAAFATVALVACCVPALKASNVDPAIALRDE